MKYMSEKELAYNQILDKICFLEEEMSDIVATYYIPLHFKVNGISIQSSYSEIFQSLIYDYKNVVLKDLYDEIYPNELWDNSQ